MGECVISIVHMGWVMYNSLFTLNHSSLFEHDLQVLDTLRIPVPLALEGLLDDRRFPLLDLDDAAFDGPSNLVHAHTH